MIDEDILTLNQIIRGLAKDGEKKDLSFSIKNGRIPSVEVFTVYNLNLDESHKLLDGFVDKKKTGQVAINAFKGGVTTVGVRKIIKL